MNVSVTDYAPDTYQLASAILLYSTGPNQGAIAVRHNAREKDGRASLGPGEFVTAGVVSELMALLNTPKLSYIPENTIAISESAVAWFEPAATRTMFFRAETDSAVAAFDKKLVPQPALLFVARRQKLSVFALPSNERPTLNTPLFLAPYWNVYDDNRVCLGSMRVPKSFKPEDTSAWTAAFFASEFTHLSGGKRWAHSGTYAEMLTDAVAAGTFKSKWLKPSRLTVERTLCGN